MNIRYSFHVRPRSPSFTFPVHDLVDLLAITAEVAVQCELHKVVDESGVGNTSSPDCAYQDESEPCHECPHYHDVDVEINPRGDGISIAAIVVSEDV